MEGDLAKARRLQQGAGFVMGAQARPGRLQQPREQHLLQHEVGRVQDVQAPGRIRAQGGGGVMKLETNRPPGLSMRAQR